MDKITFKEYLDNLVVSLKESQSAETTNIKESVRTAYVSMEKRLDTAYASMEKRLEGMNEFRDQLKDQAARFVTREELGTIIASQNTVILALQKDIAGLHKVQYIGLGALGALQFALEFFVK